MKQLITIIIPAYILVIFLISASMAQQSETIGGLYDLSLEELMNVRVKVEVASLFEEDEMIVGSSVSSATPCQWKRLGARRTSDVFGGQTGMVNIPAAAGSDISAIRGYASQASIRGVAWMLDGIPMAHFAYGGPVDTVGNWELGTLDKIEIIKGPGSAIYGSDAFQGVVSLKTFESDTDHVFVEVAGALPLYGNTSMKISRGGWENKFRIDAAAAISHQGDLDMEYKYDDPGSFGMSAKSGTGTRKYEYDSGSGMVKMRFFPTDKLTLKLGGYLSRWKPDEHSGIRWIITHSRDADTMARDSSFEMGKGDIVLDLGNQVKVEAKGYYWESGQTLYSDAPEDYYTYFADTLPSLAISEFKNTVKDRCAGSEITIKQPDNNWNLQWLAGYSYKHLKVASDMIHVKEYPSGQWVESPFEPVPGKGGTHGESRNIHSFFSQVKWGLMENTLYLLAGGRYDRYSDFGGQASPRGGLIYIPSEDVAIKALYGRAFSAPAANEMTNEGTVTKGSEDMDSEIIDVYELIFIQHKEDWKLTLNTFYSKWKDGIIKINNPDFDPSGPYPSIENTPFIFANEGKNRSYGCEATLQYTFKPIGVDAGFAWVKSQALNRHDPIDSAKTIDIDYDAYPAYSIKLGLYYFLEPHGVTFFLNNQLYLDMKEYPSSLKSEDRSPDDLDPFWRTDLNISKSFAEKIDVSLDIRNLFDRENVMPSLWGMEYGLEEPGISVLLRVGYRF